MSRKIARVFATLSIATAAATLTGCAIHVQHDVKEVAYDFSDRDFYDRAYAPSPAYETAYLESRDAQLAAEQISQNEAQEEIVLLPPPAGLPADSATAESGPVPEAR